jgi:hypothetical protein
MINNYSNINKTDNYLSPQIIEDKSFLKSPHTTWEIQILALDSHKNVARLNRLMGSQSFPSW